MRDSLVGISTRLASIASMAYFLLYLAAIPLFACYYAASSRAFYSTITGLEPQARRELASLESALQSEIVDPQAPPAPRWPPIKQPKPVPLPSDAVRVHLINASRDSLFGRLLVDLPDRDHRIIDHAADMTIHAHEPTGFSYRVSPSERRARSIWIRLDWSSSLLPEWQDSLEERLFPQHFGGRGNVTVRVPPALFRRIRNHMDTVGGLPAGFRASFPRMLYLSIVTITTLGYRDIVPIRGLSRACVGVEAVLGVVLLGLFLNSLAYEMRSGQHPAAPDGPRPGAQSG